MRFLNKNDTDWTEWNDKMNKESSRRSKQLKDHKKSLKSCRRCKASYNEIIGLIHFNHGYCSERCFVFKV